VKLFASVLKREGDAYFLVTPVEKCGIIVDDAPFVAVEMRIVTESDDAFADAALHFRTNVDDWVVCGPNHGLRFEKQIGADGLVPYLHVRNGLWAKMTRSLFYDLVDRGEEKRMAGELMFGVSSAGTFFPMARADSLPERT
jgi:hypothetical protein